MKSKFYKTLAIIMGMMMSFSIVSCGDNDEPEPEDTKAVAYYDVKYDTDLDADWYKFFDVTVTYVNGAGEEKTEAIDTDFNLQDKIQASMTPDAINFKIHVARKATTPEYDPNEIYHFNGHATFFVQAYLKDDTTGDFYGSFLPETTLGTTINGKDMEKFLERYKDSYIFERSAVIRK